LSELFAATSIIGFVHEYGGEYCCKVVAIRQYEECVSQEESFYGKNEGKKKQCKTKTQKMRLKVISFRRYEVILDPSEGIVHTEHYSTK
jgi:hypothetical protein